MKMILNLSLELSLRKDKQSVGENPSKTSTKFKKRYSKFQILKFFINLLLIFLLFFLSIGDFYLSLYLMIDYLMKGFFNRNLY